VLSVWWSWKQDSKITAENSAYISLNTTTYVWASFLLWGIKTFCRVLDFWRFLRRDLWPSPSRQDPSQAMVLVWQRSTRAATQAAVARRLSFQIMTCAAQVRIISYLGLSLLLPCRTSRFCTSFWFLFLAKHAHNNLCGALGASVLATRGNRCQKLALHCRRSPIAFHTAFSGHQRSSSCRRWKLFVQTTSQRWSRRKEVLLRRQEYCI